MQTVRTTPQVLSLSFVGALILTLAWATTAKAAGPGDLDPSFNGTGVVTTSITSIDDHATSVAIQSDGKIVVGGYFGPYHNSDMALVRYQPDGDLDTSFNGSGIVTNSFGNDFVITPKLAIQPDGKILAVGSRESNPSEHDFLVVRYNNDGTLDTDFNGTGIVTTSTGINTYDLAYSVAIQADHNIVVIGISQNTFTLARYDSDGNLDLGFNGTGIVTTTINGYGIAVAIQPDNKIVAAGQGTTDFSHYYFVVARYNSDGSLDTSFNGTGVVTTSIQSDGRDEPYDLAIQPDGKIVVAGLNRVGNNFVDGNFALMRYTITGSLDSTFNGTGIVTTSIDGKAAAAEIAIQPDAKIIAAGVSNNNFAVARYNSDGSLDTTFHGTGIVTTSISSNEETGHAAALQPDGKIVVAGFAGVTNSYGDFAIVRYLGDNADTQPPTFPNNPLTGSPLITPTQGITVNTSRPFFDWEDASDDIGVISYTLIITGDSLSLQAAQNVTTIQSNYTPVEDLPDGVYTWAVSAHDWVGNITTVFPPETFAVQTEINDPHTYLPAILKDE